MEKSIKLGAINKLSMKYENISYASKESKYICPECERDVILRKGEKNRIHFAHKKESVCKYYENPSESQIHKDGKMLFENSLLEIYKKCEKCQKESKYELPQYEEKNSVKIEYSFKYKNNEENEDGELKIADIAYVNENKKIIWICEIMNTHKTKDEDRPEPWNEIDAKKLLKTNINKNVKIKMECNRKYICSECEEIQYKLMDKLSLKDLLNNKENDIENFIKYKLGYRKCNLTKKILTGIKEFSKNSYNCLKDNKKNNEIVEYFSIFYENKKVIILIHKGYIYIKFVSNKEKINLEHIEINNSIDRDSIYANPNEQFVCMWLGDYDEIYVILYILKKIQRKYVLINYDIKKGEKYYEKIQKERDYLLVNFEDKEKIKKLGGLWDIDLKKWYIFKNNANKENILNNFERINIYLSEHDKYKKTTIISKAQKKLKEWLDNSGDDYRGIDEIYYRSNRESGVFLNYPICENINELDNKKETSWSINWDEINGTYDEYVPTYNECIKKFESKFIETIDVVCSHKGSPHIGIELYIDKSISEDKIKKLKKANVSNLIEIDANWILSQNEKPNKLKYNKLL